MLKKILLLTVLLGFLGFVCSITPARAQDPVKLRPDIFSVKLENESVRVLEWTFKPGDKELIHTHPEMVIYYLTGGKLRVYGRDGKLLREVDAKAGDTYWYKPMKHALENIGSTTIHAIIVELKTNPFKEYGD
ncbi:MAG TPA: cupin domain-containing protein [Thermodesulfobacteriota bacterium]|nr:cupin domain-containing protein [Thermodesulfobacteriota bacterium]